MHKSAGFWRVFITCCAANCVSNATWWLEPVLVEQLISQGKLSYSAIGLTVSVEMTMLALISVLAARMFVGRRFLRLGAVALGAAAIASAFSLLADNYIPYLILRGLVGAATGVCLVVANAALTQLGDADRNFTRMTLVTVLFGMALVFAIPYVSVWNGHPSSLVLLAFTLIAMLPLMFVMPAGLTLLSPPPIEPDNPATSGFVERKRLWPLYMVAPLIAIASGIMWSFYAVIGARAQLSPAQINQATATAIFASLAGIVLGTVLAGKVNRVLAIIGGLSAMGGAIAILALVPDPWAFRIATCTNVAAMVFVMPYIFSTAAVMDPSGRAASVANSSFFFGGAVAPFIGGILAETVGIPTMGVVALTILALALFFYLASARRGQNVNAAPMMQV